MAFTTPVIHFSQDVLRVFTNNGAKTCAQAGCHSGANPQAGQNLEAANAYAINDNTDVHFVMSDGAASWSMVYMGGLFLDAKYRAH